LLIYITSKKDNEKIVNYAVICLFLVITCTALPSFSQAKEDVITMKNGEKKTGKIASVTKTTVKFPTVMKQRSMK